MRADPRLRSTAFVAGLGLLATEWAAQAATYNFYFNNTEQGDHSTSTPSVTVTDGKVTKVPDPSQPAETQGPAPASADPEAPESAPPPAPAASTASLSAALPPPAPAFRHFRVTATTARMDGADVGGALGVGYFFSREFGFHLYGGAQSAAFSNTPSVYGGGELEISPLRISLGRIENLVEAGVLAGVSTVRPAYDNWVSPHIGARANLNLGDQWALTAVVRGNASYAMAEAGLSLRF